MARAVPLERMRILVRLAALGIWLTALLEGPFGLCNSRWSTATLVSVVIFTVVLCAPMSALLWARMRRTARRNAYRAAVGAERASADRKHTRDAAQVLASQVIAATGSVGCAAVVVSGGRESPSLSSVYSAAGRSGRRAHTIGPDTRFEIGSLTKIFTGLILADMVVRKEVDLETPLGTLLNIRASNAVTLRSLATHTSGLPRHAGRPRLTLMLTAHRDPYRGIDLDRVIAALARKPPPMPGRFRYSNVGYQLLGVALATAAGTTWTELLQQRICGPLGMTATRLGPDATTARGHDKAGFLFPYSDYALLPGAIGLSSSAADLDKFLRAQLDPGSVSLGLAIRLSRTPQTSAGSPRPTGLGWRVKTSGDATLAWHKGLTNGFSAVLGVITTTEERKGLAILTNSLYASTIRIAGLSMMNQLQVPTCATSDSRNVRSAKRPSLAISVTARPRLWGCSAARAAPGMLAGPTRAR